MSNYKNAKNMAKSLRDALNDQNISLSHSTCLEIVAKQFGFANWNTLSAKLPAEEQQHTQPQDHKNLTGVNDVSPTTHTAKPWSACSFCGKSSHEVKSLVGGCGGWEGFRTRQNPENGERSNVFICDECVTLIAKNFADTIGTAKDSPVS